MAVLWLLQCHQKHFETQTAEQSPLKICCTWNGVVLSSDLKCFAACKVLQDELHRKILDSLLDFTRKRSSTRQHSDWASQMRASEIPTAALVLGVLVTLTLSDLLFNDRFRTAATSSHTFITPDIECHTSPIGVNVPDHDMTFQSLSELLQQSVSPFVASVQAKECGGKELHFLWKLTSLFLNTLCLYYLLYH